MGPLLAWVPGVAGVPADAMGSTSAGGYGRPTTHVAESYRRG